jgi:hypothetical protein
MGEAMSGKKADDYKQDYTDPELREQLKEKIKASSKGGRSGQWSARKSQLLTHEYEKQGGDYKHAGKRSAGQRSLQEWTDEEWQTKDGSANARHGKTTERYLPAKAWEKLSPEERRKTNARKKAGSRQGRQNVPNTKAAKQARSEVTHAGATRDDLYEQAKKKNVPGRSKMNKSELEKALRETK